MKLSVTGFANSIALAFAVVHIGFDFLSFFSPGLVKDIFNSWYHGYYLKIVLLTDSYQFSLLNMVYGLVTSVVVAWVLGAMVAFFYNIFSAKKS